MEKNNQREIYNFYQVCFCICRLLKAGMPTQNPVHLFFCGIGSVNSRPAHKELFTRSERAFSCNVVIRLNWLQDHFRIGTTGEAHDYRLLSFKTNGIDLGISFKRLGSAARPNEVQPGAQPRDSSFGAVATKTTQLPRREFGVA